MTLLGASFISLAAGLHLAWSWRHVVLSTTIIAAIILASMVCFGVVADQPLFVML